MAKDKDFGGFKLTPADYCFPMFYAGCTISFRLQCPESGVTVLREAIDRLASHLPFLKGAVVPSVDSVGVMEVRSNAHDDLASDTESPLCIVRRFLHLRLPTETYSSRQKNVETYDRNAALAMAPVHVAASAAYHPVIRFQINVLADGIILALFVNHMVIDGTGIGTLLESIAACCRSAPDLASNPACEVTTRALFATLQQEPCKLSEPSTSAEIAAPTGHDEVHDASLLDYNFLLSAEKIKALRQWVLQADLEPGQPPVSEDDILTAVLWICLGRFRSHPLAEGGSSHACVLQRVVNARHRLRPQVPAHYLGNCFVMLNETLPTTDLDLEACQGKTEAEQLGRQIAPAARLLRKRLTEVDDRFVKDYLSQFSRADDWASTSVHEPNVAVTSIRRLRVYEEDFGPVLGKVVEFEMLPYMNPEGVCTIKPRRHDQHAWEVGVTLSREDMDRLGSDARLRWLVERESPLRIFESVL
ncbi:putative acetyltransferase [Aspergillus clavatus NRRL 1]|uniref:Acetyltransferase, putative n=1 Tax=Aspergillus clavatus (strain ATCC 1007 / CBS 513.65 / DSM 816 / NCTC 3887 / NRRL 1 / QM 1276 / 107) TaxID=344612 RepID=A1C4G1_ASPCL|nr:acetyltransferase, putative [Aspergillus clavatus NRRL 1]EAW15301.1 acetyltransferase, putative [Aspergillus clavatus NRRL 1]